MALSLNPIDVLKLFSERKRRDKEQIATWLEQTAAEARMTAEVWTLNRDRIREAISDAEEYLMLKSDWGPTAPYMLQMLQTQSTVPLISSTSLV